MPLRRPPRPMRCRNEASDGGGPTSTTSSMLPMSMPSSNVEVETQMATLRLGEIHPPPAAHGRVQVGVVDEDRRLVAQDARADRRRSARPRGGCCRRAATCARRPGSPASQSQCCGPGRPDRSCGPQFGIERRALRLDRLHDGVSPGRRPLRQPDSAAATPCGSGTVAESATRCSGVADSVANLLAAWIAANVSRCG